MRRHAVGGKVDALDTGDAGRLELPFHVLRRADVARRGLADLDRGELQRAPVKFVAVYLFQIFFVKLFHLAVFT